jgi:hypothetical protein
VRAGSWNPFITSFITFGMSGRLASFKGPSTPLSPESPPSGRKKTFDNKGAIAGNKGSANLTPPVSPGRELESTIHRKIRVLLLEIRSICRLWSDIVLRDGLKAVKTLVDTRTELECVSGFALQVYLSARLTVDFLSTVMPWPLYRRGRTLNTGLLAQSSGSWTNRFAILRTSSQNL